MNRPNSPNAGTSASPRDALEVTASAKARVINIDDPLIGKRLVHFEIRERLGQGENGIVYLVHDGSLQQPAALKLLRRPLGADSPVGAELLAAARRQATVSHQNVAQVRFVGADSEGRPFIVSEYVAGTTLRAELQRAGAMPWAQAVGHMFEIVRGLQAAQAAGLTHGALTPANIIFSRGDGAAADDVEIKVVDFGARAAHAGNPNDPYAAPEQTAGAPGDMRSDMFALGAIFHEMLTAAPPQPGRELPEGLAPAYIRRLVAFLMRPDPKHRPSGYDELIGRLEVALIKPGEIPPRLSRLVAFAIDTFAMAGLCATLALVLPRAAPISIWEAVQFGFVAFLGYSVCAHKMGRQSIGKQLCAVKLQKPRQGLGWGRMIVRCFVQMWGPIVAFALIDLELGLDPDPAEIKARLGRMLWVLGALWLSGFLVVLTDRKGQALHDHVTGTSVVAG